MPNTDLVAAIAALRVLMKLIDDLIGDDTVPPEKRDEAKAARKEMMAEWKKIYVEGAGE